MTSWAEGSITLVKVKPTLQYLWRQPVAGLAFGFGAGLAPRMPGTVGTLAAIPFYLVLQYLPLWGYLLTVVIGFIVGIYICGITAEKLGVHDHGGIVWDEFIGYWIAMIGAPSGWFWIILGFVLFRLFDILKPWPISVADRRLKGGLGIMLDDVMAGIAAAVGLQIVVYFAG